MTNTEGTWKQTVIPEHEDDSEDPNAAQLKGQSSFSKWGSLEDTDQSNTIVSSTVHNVGLISNTNVVYD